MNKEKYMKKIAAIATILAFGLGLVACGNSAGHEAEAKVPATTAQSVKPTPTPTPKPKPPVHIMPKPMPTKAHKALGYVAPHTPQWEKYRSALNASFPQFKEVSDSMLIGLGESACGALKQGVTFERIYELALKSYDKYSGMAVMVFVVRTTCPWELPK
jgi:hypothetical protein